MASRKVQPTPLSVFELTTMVAACDSDGRASNWLTASATQVLLKVLNGGMGILLAQFRIVEISASLDVLFILVPENQ
jgi:hypothetical protein